MSGNEFAFVVLVAGAFFLLVGLKGLFDLGMDYLFDRQQSMQHAKELVKLLKIAGISVVVCLVAWRFI